MADTARAGQRWAMIDLWDAAPVEVQDEVIAMLAESRSTHPVGPYVDSVNERLGLLSKIVTVTNAIPDFADHYKHNCPNSAIQALVMKADLEVLRSTVSNLVDAFEDYQQHRNEVQFMQDIARIPVTLFDDAVKAIDYCRAKPGPTPKSPAPTVDDASSGSSSAGSRGPEVTNASKRAKERDGNVCLFTGTPNPEAAHIFPFASSQRPLPQQRQAIKTLALFWGTDKVNQWLNETREILETPRNRVSMSHQLRFEFDVKASFALKPISCTNTSVVVQWHWLKPSGLMRRTPITQDTITAAGIHDPEWGNGPTFARCPSGLKIKTGQTFTIKTDEPDRLPVPSYALLELNWILACVAAMAGAAEESDEDVDDDSEDEEIGESATGYSEEDDIENSEVENKGIAN